VLTVANGQIQSVTKAQGSGGNIVIRADQMTVTGAIAGPANDPQVITHAITTSAAPGSAGKAGNIRITADELSLVDGAITSRAEGTGEGGSIDIKGRRLVVTGDGQISTESVGKKNAGDITIANTDTILLQGNSKITTEAKHADGGNITLTGGSLVRLQDSHITATVGGGEGTTGGNIDINSQAVVLQNSTIRADAPGGQGGDIRIAGGVLLVDPTSRITATGKTDGDIDLPPTTNLSGLVTPIPPDFAVTAALQPNRCLARLQEGRVSSLVVSGRSGVPPEPEGGLPSLLLEAAWEAAPPDDSQESRSARPPGHWATAQAQRQAWPKPGPVHLVIDPACAR
jgi:large exoprotein involved in heme utilization and adhesion